MNILFATSELYPFVKTGGLSDVSYALPKALEKEGVKISIIIPFYSSIDESKWLIKFNTEFTVDSTIVEIHQSSLPHTSIPVYFVKCDELYRRDGGPYGTSLADYSDNHLRFYFFSRVIEEVVNNPDLLNESFDLVHCNDWQTGLVPLLLKYEDSPAKSLFTIHNMAYGGIFPKEKLADVNLPEDVFHHDKIEFYGSFSYLKAGLVFADKLTTVSPCYAQEIQQLEYGCGFDGLLKARAVDLVGILNGIDKDEWCPKKDASLIANYSADDLAGKQKNKTQLQDLLKLPVAENTPVISLVGRLVEQKGIDFVIDAIPVLVEMGCQVVILGQGQPEYETNLLALAQHYPTNCWVKIGYNEKLAHQIEAGSDVFLMPSIFEPCGLNQLYSLAYGTLPLVTAVGGLKDTVEGFTGNNLETATGFVMASPSSIDLIETLSFVIETYRDQATWQQLQKNAMQKNFSWRASAHRYLECYEQLLNHP